jgi:hypothetical protein
MFAVALDERLAQPIGIFVQLLQRAALRTDEPLAERILSITTDAFDLDTLHLDLEAARCLTQRTGAIRDTGVRHGLILP